MNHSFSKSFQKMFKILHYHVFILFIFTLNCYFIFGFYLIFQVLFNKSGKDKRWGYIFQISGN